MSSLKVRISKPQSFEWTNSGGSWWSFATIVLITVLDIFAWKNPRLRKRYPLVENAISETLSLMMRTPQIMRTRHSASPQCKTLIFSDRGCTPYDTLPSSITSHTRHRDGCVSWNMRKLHGSYFTYQPRIPIIIRKASKFSQIMVRCRYVYTTKGALRISGR